MVEQNGSIIIPQNLNGPEQTFELPNTDGLSPGLEETLRLVRSVQTGQRMTVSVRGRKIGTNGPTL
ncbi:hypothetical protein HYU92_01650 [Candidatus Curtissbacteria bacterium]|nr:hypothetical protein [Candidatus Curtissbacteria bacterium]